mmetsp:Transcript_32267/g.51459  ORF Transcript_32267/g.51459 Transcript_32267/m.51459 type:complete len:854 (-) Transcript_32267:656-3217(-)
MDFPCKDFPYLLSCDIKLNVTFKVKSLETVSECDCDDLYLTSQLFVGGYPSHIVSQCTHSCERISKDKVYWGEWLTLPVKYCDLQENASVLISVWSSSGLVGVANAQVFDEAGRVRRGRLQLKLSRELADSSYVPEGDGIWKTGEKYNHEEIPRLGWLDSLARVRTKQVTANRQHSEPVLTIEFPYFEYPIVFEERAYYSERMDAILMRSHEEQLEREEALGRQKNQKQPAFPWQNHLCVIHDPEMMHAQGRAMDMKEILNPVEEKYRRLNPSMVRGVVDRFLKPNKSERDKIQQIIHSSGKMTRRHQDVLWKFAYSLTNDKKALIKFVMSVDWGSPSEVKVAEELLNTWAHIDMADALRLLGDEPEFRNPAVRGHAIKILDEANDAELLLYLLQLVQALRYDNIKPETTTGGEEDKGDEQGKWKPGLLARFLIRRAVNSESLVSFFTWYLSTEVENKENGMLFSNVHQELLHQLRMSPRGRGLAAQLTEQTNFVKKIMMMGKEGRGRALTRQNYLQRMLTQADGKYHELRHLHVPVMHPLWPWKRVTGIDSESLRVFNSKTQPIKIDLTLEEQGQVSPALFKVGDDLRQDQLVLQLLGVMDKMFKDVNLDLHLTLYRVLSFSNDEGMMEFVKGSKALSQIQKQDGTISAFFKAQAKELCRKEREKYTPDEAANVRFETEAEMYDKLLNRFIKSCAGYCMCTYILCVGDRHLDNILIRNTGELLHIDFGYILGHDPRSWAVGPIRLTKDMIDTMGGRGSKGFDKFISHCCQAYKILRKHANLILNLLYLMKDSKIENLFEDHETVIQIVRNRFELEKTDENAEIWLLDKLNKCEDTFVTTLSDTLHNMNLFLN